MGRIILKSNNSALILLLIIGNRGNQWKCSWFLIMFISLLKWTNKVANNEVYTSGITSWMISKNAWMKSNRRCFRIFCTVRRTLKWLPVLIIYFFVRLTRSSNQNHFELLLRENNSTWKGKKAVVLTLFKKTVDFLVIFMTIPYFNVGVFLAEKSNFTDCNYFLPIRTERHVLAKNEKVINKTSFSLN